MITSTDIGAGRWVTRYSWPSGIPYRVMEGGVPQRIPDYYLDCSIYIYPTKTDAYAGSHVGGCGFLVNYPLSVEGWASAYAVTNQHVLAGCKGDVFVRLNTKAGKTEVLPIPKDNWFPHPDGDDLAIHMIETVTENYRFAPFPYRMFATEAIMKSEDIGIGDEVFMVGRFINHEGRQANKPTVRFGNISMMPGEPIKNPKSGVNQDSYLIECRSMGGYSGSPVFVMTYQMDLAQRRRRGFTGWPRGPYLLGINWCHLNYFVPVKDVGSQHLTVIMTEPDEIDTKEYVTANSGMAGVVPVSKLIDLLELPEVKILREKEDSDLRKKLATPNPVTLDIEEKKPFTQEDFEDALKKTTRKLSSEK